MSKIVFIDTEVDISTGKVCDYGAIDLDNKQLHTSSESTFSEFLKGNDFICGHNILAHDLKYIEKTVDESGIRYVIDTLFLSPLLFPSRPYHALLKDDKLQTDELNNPLNDSLKARDLFHDEVNAFKLASLLLLEDVKHEQLLMVTFSRAAATEFKQRLYALIGNAASFVEIKTFHSYCFDLLGKIGSLQESDQVVKNAAEMIKNGDVELGRITKTVVVIDEAQDMDENEFALIQALMDRNEEMRVIAVGDDDQNIYQFRGSDSKHLRSFIADRGSGQIRTDRKLPQLSEHSRACKSFCRNYHRAYENQSDSSRAKG